MKQISNYAWLTLLGAVLPLWFFVPFLAEHGLDLPEFFGQLFANRISSFFAMDVLISGVVTIVFIVRESHRLGIQAGKWCLLGLIVGVSVALPLFLWMRERQMKTR